MTKIIFVTVMQSTFEKALKQLDFYSPTKVVPEAHYIEFDGFCCLESAQTAFETLKGDLANLFKKGEYKISLAFSELYQVVKVDSATGLVVDTIAQPHRSKAIAHQIANNCNIYRENGYHYNVKEL